MKTQTYYNRSQLARRLNITHATLVRRIEAGEIKPDAHDAKGEELFSEETVASYEKKGGAK